MRRAAKTIDISDLPDLRRVAEEVRAAKEPYLLRAGDQDVALLIPLREEEPRPGGRTQADRTAFLSAFGGWKGIVDGETLKRESTASRGSDRPLVVL